MSLTWTCLHPSSLSLVVLWHSVLSYIKAHKWHWNCSALMAFRWEVWKFELLHALIDRCIVFYFWKFAKFILTCIAGSWIQNGDQAYRTDVWSRIQYRWSIHLYAVCYQRCLVLQWGVDVHRPIRSGEPLLWIVGRRIYRLWHPPSSRLQERRSFCSAERQESASSH